MRRAFSLVSFVIIAVLLAAIYERAQCQWADCDMELVGYIFNDPIILIAYSAISVVLCFLPSVWLSKRIGPNVSTSIIPLIMAILMLLLGVENNEQSAVRMGLWVLMPLLAGNVVGLHIWPKLSANIASKNA